MENQEAIRILKACQPLARRLVAEPANGIAEQDIILLADFDRVYQAHLATKDEILSEAQMLMDEVAMLIAALSDNRNSINLIRADETEQP